MSDTKGKSVGKYPPGAIRQHHALATGAPLETVDTRDLGGGFKSDGPAAKPNSIKKSGTSTGSRSKGGY
jgi:hypothetical protein